MADTQIYGTMCTDIGNAAIANSVLTGTKVNFAQIAVGDGDGTPYVPVSGMTALKHQVWSGPIAEVSQDPEQPNRMILHAVLPSSVGGWVMREIGVLDDKGRMIAIGNTPEIPKESMTSGTIMEMDLYIYISVVDARGVNVVIDPTVIIATKADINELWQAVTAHNTASDAHATLFAAKEGLLKDAASKTTPEDTDKVPMVDSADGSKTKLLLWSAIKAALGSVFAALTHTHKWADITNPPSNFTPSTHASTHATGGSDPIDPGDIGAAEEPITGTSAPTTSTVGVVGQFYIDTSSKQLYICTAIDNGVYTWDSASSKQWKILASYTTAGSYTFTVPAGITKLRAFIIGGGGSGEAHNHNSLSSDAYGGSSGHSQLYFNDTVINGQQFNVVVGSGGSSVQASYPSPFKVYGENGSSSSFDGHSAEGGSGGSEEETGLEIGGGQGNSSNYTRGTACPAFGEIRSGVFNSIILQASTTPPECFNPFDSHRVLMAGGYASNVSVELYKIDDYGNHGSSGVYSSSPGSHAIKGTSYGCGGGGCVQTNGDYTATSAAGADGAVLIYGM